MPPRPPTYTIPNFESSDEIPAIFYTPAEEGEFPVKEIPGSHGIPFIGAIRDRWDFYYNQGRDGFFQARLDKYNSTVFRANAPPGRFIAKNPKVIVLLDGASFPILFDTSKVEKKNILDGTCMPSVGFTGGFRVLAYLDPSEPKHKALKSFLLGILSAKQGDFIPILRKNLTSVFDTLDSQMAASEEVEFNKISDIESFNYVFNLFCGVNPADTALGTGASKTVDLWLLPQLIPLFTLGPPKILRIVEDLLFHTFPIPSFLVKSKYSTIYEAFSTAAKDVLDMAKSYGLERDEACHNLIFIACFNAYGGFKVLVPSLFKWLGRAGPIWHAYLAKEIRTAVKQEGGVTLAALAKMPLLKSTVYEVLRIDPPVPFQYAHAKEDLTIQSHDASFKVKKGEMLFGYQTFATNDPKIFKNPEEFVPYRFRGKGEANIKYVYWSNGCETDPPTVDNKQCPGRDLVVLVARVTLVDFFLRYDTFTCTDKPFLAGSKVFITSLTKATAGFTQINDSH